MIDKGSFRDVEALGSGFEIRSEIARQASKAMQEKREKIVLERLSALLGREIAVADLLDMSVALTVQQVGHMGGEIYYLDGQPFLRFHPHALDGEGRMMELSVKYEILR